MKTGRNVLRLFSHIFVLAIVLIMSVAFTFSWYNPLVKSTETGNSLKYTISGKINRISGCELETIKGSNVNGIISYSGDPVTGTQTDKIAEDHGVVYYRTLIYFPETEANKGDAIVSLYANSISSTNGDAYVGVFSPEKTYEKASGTPVCIADNIVVPSNGNATIYWYVSATKGSNVTVGDLFLAYN